MNVSKIIRYVCPCVAHEKYWPSTAQASVKYNVSFLNFYRIVKKINIIL